MHRGVGTTTSPMPTRACWCCHLCLGNMLVTRNRHSDHQRNPKVSRTCWDGWTNTCCSPHLEPERNPDDWVAIYINPRIFVLIDVVVHSWPHEIPISTESPVKQWPWWQWFPMTKIYFSKKQMCIPKGKCVHQKSNVHFKNQIWISTHMWTLKQKCDFQKTNVRCKRHMCIS